MAIQRDEVEIDLGQRISRALELIGRVEERVRHDLGLDKPYASLDSKEKEQFRRYVTWVLLALSLQ